MDQIKKIKLESAERESEHFYIEAAINEEGPKKLRVIPSKDEYIIYEGDQLLCRIKPADGGEWEPVEGDISRGIADVIGRAIKRVTGK